MQLSSLDWTSPYLSYSSALLDPRPSNECLLTNLSWTFVAGNYVTKQKEPR